MANKIIPHIIKQLQDIQTGKVWVGATYEGHLDTITDLNAFVRPHPQLHSIAEIISHLTTWRKETIIKIRTGKGRLTDDCKENWYPVEILKEKSWNAILKEYDSSLHMLIELLSAKEDDFLEETYYDPDFRGEYPYSFVVNGMLHHDIYHLGQIGIVMKYLKMMDRP